MKTKKILITGSSGTIGTRLFEKLLEKKYQVFGFDRKLNKWNKKIDDLTIHGDLLNIQDINKIDKEFDIVVHLAANARVYDLVVDPDKALENIISTYNILNFIRTKNIKNFIFSSSRETYGNRKKICAKETDVDILLCESPYSASKISDEALAISFSKCYGIDNVILRFSNVYGMYDQSDRFIPLIIKKMKAGQDVQIYGKDKILDFTYIDDCVDGIIKCIERFEKVKNNVFNIASGDGNKLVDVAKIIKKSLNNQSKIIIESNRKGEVIKYIADITKAKKLLNYYPKTSIEKGISLSVDWYKNYE
jgi:UDP-glucose 4-epimerase